MSKLSKFAAMMMGGLWAALPLYAAAEEAPPPPAVLDTYFCSYNAGQDRDDLLAARDNYVRQLKKAGLKAQDGFVWHSFRGDMPFDFVWQNVHENLMAYAEAMDAGADSPELASALERFEQVAECTAVLGWGRNIYTGKAFESVEDPAFLNLSACRFNKGRDMDDMGDLRNHIRGVLGNSDAFAAHAVYGIVPMTNGRTAPDVVIFGVSDNVTAWANGVRTLFTTDAGQALQRHFGTVLECNNALYTSEQVVEAGS